MPTHKYVSKYKISTTQAKKKFFVDKSSLLIDQFVIIVNLSSCMRNSLDLSHVLTSIFRPYFHRVFQNVYYYCIFCTVLPFNHSNIRSRTKHLLNLIDFHSKLYFQAPFAVFGCMEITNIESEWKRKTKLKSFQFFQ